MALNPRCGLVAVDRRTFAPTPRTFDQYFGTTEDLLLVEVREFLANVEEVLERCPPELSAME